MNKLFLSKVQMKYFIVVLIGQVVLNGLYILNQLNPDIDFTWSYSNKIDNILNIVTFYVFPLIVVLLSIILLKNKWFGLKSIIYTLPFIIILYYAMSIKLTSDSFNFRSMLLLPIIICFINIVVGVIVIGLYSILSSIFKR